VSDNSTSAQRGRDGAKDGGKDGGKDRTEPKRPRDPARMAAIAVMLLEKPQARELFQILPPEDVERLLGRSEGLSDVSAREVFDVLQELNTELDRHVVGVAGHESKLREVAADALGRDNLIAILGRDTSSATDHLRRIAEADPSAFAQAISREHPQVIAVVLAILSAEVGGRVLALLAPETKADAVRRVATLRAVPAQMLAEVAEIVGRELRVGDEVGPVQIDGLASAVGLMKAVGNEQEEVIFEDLERRDAELTEALRSRMFVFEDILKLHAREVQLILREVDGQQLAVGLKAATNQLKEFVLGNMSSRAAMIVLDDMEAMGPVARAQIEEAQAQILAVVARLAEEGKVNTRPGDGV
jgi:flagellar motor switch protein FliG